MNFSLVTTQDKESDIQHGSRVLPNRIESATRSSVGSRQQREQSIPALWTKSRTWDRDELEEVLDFFQVDHSQAKQKAELFDLLCDKVVHDRGVDESAIAAPLLLRFIRDDDGAVSQPLIGVKPKENDDESDSEGSRQTHNVQSSLRRKYEDMMAPRSANLTDYWPHFPCRDCEVCGTALIRTVNTPWRRITGECAHRSTICLSCLQQHIQNQLEMNTLIVIPCVMCKATLAPDDIKAWTAPEFFERYQRISVQQTVHEGLSFRWCVAVARTPSCATQITNPMPPVMHVEKWRASAVMWRTTRVLLAKLSRIGEPELNRKCSQRERRSGNPGRRFVEYLSNAPGRTAESEFKRTTAATI